MISRPPASGTFESLATRPNELVLVAKPGLVWPGRAGEMTWLVREEGSSTRAAVDEVMARLAVTPTVITIGSNTAIQRSAEAGLGVALLPTEAVSEALRTRTLTTIHTDGTPLRKPWHVLVRAGETPSAATSQFVDDLVSIGGEFEWTPVGAALASRGSG